MANHEKEHESEGGGHSGGHRGHAGHGGSHEEHEGAPEWLISFADNVALMMGFFVVLLAMNMKPPTAGAPAEESNDQHATAEAKESSPEMLDFVIALREAFNNPVNLNATSPAEQPLRQRLLDKIGAGEAKSPGQKGREPENRSVRPTDYYALGGKVFFARGEDSLSASARAELAEFTPKLRGLRSLIEVRGHTSAAESYNLPDRGKQLSMKRALAVAEALAAAGVDWEHLQVMACGDNDRAVPKAYDEQGQEVNQRVEILVTNFPLPDYLPGNSKK